MTNLFFSVVLQVPESAVVSKSVCGQREGV